VNALFIHPVGVSEPYPQAVAAPAPVQINSEHVNIVTNPPTNVKQKLDNLQTNSNEVIQMENHAQLHFHYIIENLAELSSFLFTIRK
jgi:hypothetical protein